MFHCNSAGNMQNRYNLGTCKYCWQAACSWFTPATLPESFFSSLLSPVLLPEDLHKIHTVSHTSSLSRRHYLLTWWENQVCSTYSHLQSQISTLWCWPIEFHQTQAAQTDNTTPNANIINLSQVSRLRLCQTACWFRRDTTSFSVARVLLWLKT